MATFCEFLPLLCGFPGPSPETIGERAGQVNAAVGGYLAFIAPQLSGLDAFLAAVATLAGNAFGAAPWTLVIAVLGLLVWLVSRSISLTAMSVAGLLLAGGLGFWTQTMQSLSLALAGLALALAIGLPLGLLLAMTRHAQRFLRPVVSSIAAIPSLAWLAPAAILLSAGTGAGLLAVALASLPVVIVGVLRSLQSADPDALMAARAFGASPWLRFTRLRAPLAAPAFVVALAQACALSFRTAVIAALIGAPGLGTALIEAIDARNTHAILASAAAIAIVAIILSRTARDGEFRLSRRGDVHHV